MHTSTKVKTVDVSSGFSQRYFFLKIFIVNDVAQVYFKISGSD